MFPLVKPTTLFLLVTGIIGSFQVFQNAFMMTGGGPDNSTTMIGLLIYKNAFEYSKFGLACAQAILLCYRHRAHLHAPVQAHGRGRRILKGGTPMATTGLIFPASEQP